MLQWRTVSGQLFYIWIADSTVGSEEELSETRQAAGEVLKTSSAALQCGTPAQVQFLQHSEKTTDQTGKPMCDSVRTSIRHIYFLSGCCLPAAWHQFSQASICQVSAAPQVHWAQRAATSSQHTGHNVIVFNLQWQAALTVYFQSLKHWQHMQCNCLFNASLWIFRELSTLLKIRPGLPKQL